MDEFLEEQIESAIGNIEIEGHNISDKEKELIVKIYKKYKDRLGDKAIDSLLYGLVDQLNYEEQENAKTK